MPTRLNRHSCTVQVWLYAPGCACLYMHAGKAAVRQQLQQHLRHQTQQLRGLGEYLRRHLKTLVELCMDTPPSPSEADTTGLQAPTAQQQQQGQGQAAPQSQASQRLVKASEVDRLRFVLTPSHARQGTHVCLQCCGCSIRIPQASARAPTHTYSSADWRTYQDAKEGSRATRCLRFIHLGLCVCACARARRRHHQQSRPCLHRPLLCCPLGRGVELSETPVVRGHTAVTACGTLLASRYVHLCVCV